MTILFRNATVIDGTGREPVRADVRVEGTASSRSRPSSAGRAWSRPTPSSSTATARR